MYDPKTVAHEIKLFGKYFITIWHVDPETDGTDDSCGWAFSHLTEQEQEYSRCLIENEYDNLRHWFNDVPVNVAIYRIRQIFRLHKSLVRPWWRHPRWHFWHWEFQVHPIQHFKRWAFSRCHYCGGRFRWGESPLSLVWHGTGPRWFRSEEKVLHLDCYPKYQREKNTRSIDTARSPVV